MSVHVLTASKPLQPPVRSARTERRQSLPPDSLPLSVVIPTLGRPQLLQRCLGALARSEWREATLEIVVVDDGPHEPTRAAVARWMPVMAQRGMVLRYLPSPGPHGPAAARNRGWRAACGRVIAFTDDDTEPEPGWLRAGLEAFMHGAEAAWGRTVMPLPSVPTDYERDAAGLERGPFITANCFCLRSVLETLGGFDERFPIAWREDSDLYFRLLDAQVRIDYVAEAVVIHPVRPAPWGVSMRQQRKVLFDALLYKKHPRLYRERIRPRPPWRYYFIVASLAVVLTGIVTGSAALSVVGACGWGGATLSFAWERLRDTSKAPLHVLEMLVTSSVIPLLAVFWRLRGAVRFATPFI